MKKTIILIIFILSITNTNAQSFVGAWERNHVSEQGEELKSVVIFSDGFQSISTYEAQTGKFIYSNGGTWELSGDTMTEKVEFDTNDSSRVGSEVNFKVIISDSTMAIVGSEMKFIRIDNGKPGKLEGSWLMSARIK